MYLIIEGNRVSSSSNRPFVGVEMYYIDDSASKYIGWQVEDKKGFLVFFKKGEIDKEKLRNLVSEKIILSGMGEDTTDIENQISDLKKTIPSDETIEFEYKKFLCENVTEQKEVEKYRVVEEEVEVEQEQHKRDEEGYPMYKNNPDGTLSAIMETVLVKEAQEKMETYIDIEEVEALSMKEV